MSLDPLHSSRKARRVKRKHYSPSTSHYFDFDQITPGALKRTHSSRSHQGWTEEPLSAVSPKPSVINFICAGAATEIFSSQYPQG